MLDFLFPTLTRSVIILTYGKIKAQKHYEKFMGRGKNVYLFEMEFEQEARNMGAWLAEERTR